MKGGAAMKKKLPEQEEIGVKIDKKKLEKQVKDAAEKEFNRHKKPIIIRVS